MSPATHKLFVTLKKRPEFLRVRGGHRFTAKSFVLEGKRRPPVDAATDADSASTVHTAPRTGRDASRAIARFGFTITKKVGGAVERNRMRRRLKAALTDLSGEALPDFDYVVVARRQALEQPFDQLKADLSAGLRHISRGADKPRRPRKHKPPTT